MPKRRYTLKKAKRDILLLGRELRGVGVCLGITKDKVSEICEVVGNMRGIKKWQTKSQK